MTNQTYFVDVVLSGEAVGKVRALTEELTAEFDIESGGTYHGIISAPLFGPFDTKNESGVIYRLEEVCENFTIVPFRLSKFGHFRDEVLFASIAPSEELDDIQSKIDTGLRPITHNRTRRNRYGRYPFYVPIAHELGSEFPEAWARLNHFAPPNTEEYANRIRIWKDGEVLRVFDLPLDRTLNKTEASDDVLREASRSYVSDHKVREHHARLLPPNIGGYRQHLRRRWYTTREQLRWAGINLTWMLEQIGNCIWNRLDRVHARLSSTRAYQNLADRTIPPCRRIVSTARRFFNTSIKQPAQTRIYIFRLWLSEIISPENPAPENDTEPTREVIRDRDWPK